MEHLRSFPAFLHTLLLVQSEQPQDRQQARTWLTWLEASQDLHGLSRGLRLPGGAAGVA